MTPQQVSAKVYGDVRGIVSVRVHSRVVPKIWEMTLCHVRGRVFDEVFVEVRRSVYARIWDEAMVCYRESDERALIIRAERGYHEPQRVREAFESIPRLCAWRVLGTS